MPYWERKSYCVLSDGRIMAFFANLTLDGGLIRVRVVIRDGASTKEVRQKIIVCTDPE